MNAATIAPLLDELGHAVRLLAELHHADHIIKVMLNAMTLEQKSKCAAQLEADGVSPDGMTRAHERRAVIEATTAASTSASSQGTIQQLRDIEQQAIDILAQADHAGILLQAIFDKLDEMSATPEEPAINCFATCAARSVELMRAAAGNIITMAAEGGAA